jgi:integrase
MVVGRWKYSDVIKARIDKDIKPHIGQLAIEDVKPAHIDKMLQAIKERNAPSIANDILRWSKRILDYAIKRQIIQYNPASAFNIMDAGGKATARDRVLSKSELIIFFDVMRNSGFTKQNFLTVKLLLLLAVRKSELLEAKIIEFDLDNGLWTLPANRTKTKTSIIIPLSRQAIEALNELISLSLSSEWLLPARKVQQYKLPHIHENTLNVTLARIKPLMDMPNFCIHDFRRTARSHLAVLGVPSHIAERCLNHKLKGIEGVYNHHDYLEERRNALELWANLLTACETGKDYNITPIRQRATQ